MRTDRYYYGRLSRKEQAAYRTFYEGALQLSEAVDLPEALSAEEIHRVYQAMTMDNPHMYYLNQTRLGIRSRGGNIRLCPEYFCTAEEIRLYNSRIDAYVEELFDRLALSSCTDAQKVRRIHDALCLGAEYDDAALGACSSGRLVSAHSIIGVFSKQKAVCEGIAKTVKLLLGAADVPCIYVAGEGMSEEESGPHAWNIVKVDGVSCCLDVTWDMNRTRDGRICYDYYLVPDQAFLADHTPSGEVPSCTSWHQNYHVMQGTYFTQRRELEARLRAGAKRGVTSFYWRMRPDYPDVHALGEEMVQVLFDAWPGSGAVQASWSVNETQKTVRIRLNTT